MRRVILMLSFLGLLLCCLGCGAALSPSFTPPEQGGPPWTELWTPHFVLRTDLPESEAREMIAEFERIYTTFEDIAFPFEVKPKGRISTLVFRDEHEYKQIAPRNTRGFYRPRGEDSDDFVPSVFLYGDLTNQTRLSFQHELTHRFVHFYYPNAPQWLNEGLAQYFSTITVEDGKAIVGKPLPHLLFQPGLTWAYEETPVWRQTFVATADVPHLGTLLGSGPSDFRAAAQPSDDEKEKRED